MTLWTTRESPSRTTAEPGIAEIERASRGYTAPTLTFLKDPETMKTPSRLALSLLTMVFCPGIALAQICVGVPTSDGGFAGAGHAQFTDGSKSFGGELSVNLSGPVTLAGRYDLLTFDDIDNNGNSFRVDGAYELAVTDASVCPIAGAWHARWSEEDAAGELTLSSTIFPVGVAMGRELNAEGGLSVMLVGIPRFLHIRNKAELQGSQGGALSFSDNQNEFSAYLGVGLASGGLFATGSVLLSTIENSDPVFGLSMGFAVGGSQ